MVLNFIVLILAAKVNAFMNFFCEPNKGILLLASDNLPDAADVIPFCLALINYVVMFTSIILDFGKPSWRSGRPAIELSWLGTLTLLWLGNSYELFVFR
jgi:hypothetical protein